jgi:putative tricarboxylic transport membrane protein
LKFNDTLWGVLFIAGAAAVLLHVQAFPKIPGQNVGPALFPGLVAAGIGICGLILVARGIRARRGAGADHAHGQWVWVPPWLKSGRHLTAFLVLVGVNVFYLLAVDRLGFIPTGFIYLLAFMWVLRVRWVVSIPVAIAMTLVIHYAFYKLLKVPLPWGLLVNWAW